MSVRVEIDQAAVARAAVPGLMAVGEDIAEMARDRAAMRQLKRGRTAHHAEGRGDHVWVGTRFKLGHIDEYANGAVRSEPTGALRSAALDSGGRYEPGGGDAA